MTKYILFYSDKKPEDNLILKNMFKNNKYIGIGWTQNDIISNIKTIEESIKEGYKNIIIAGFEIGWDKMLRILKEKHKNIQIKVICNTQDSLLYYDYERENFFKLLELNQKKIVDCIAFFRKGQYLLYKSLGYKVFYLMENMKLELDKKSKEKAKGINLGIYPLNYTWDKNIFNQLCIAKMLNNCNLNYNLLDERMDDFTTTMKIKSTKDKIDQIDVEKISNVIRKNDVIVSLSFTEYLHPLFFISMENGIPCLIGNNSDLFDDNSELKKYLVSNSEDNPIENAKKVNVILDNNAKIIDLYNDWKNKYNIKCDKNIKEFIEL